MISRKARLASLILAITMSAGIAGAQSSPAGTHAADSAAAVAVVERYHDALRKADTVAAKALLDSRAVVLESGGIETRQEYIDHHLGSDMAFARAIPSPSRVQEVMVRGDVAWVASTNRSAGTFNGRAIDSDGAELMVLIRTAEDWRIAAIHWSSRRRAPR